MATGGEGNQSQIQLSYGSCVWGTGRVTTCPTELGGATHRSSVAGTVSDSDELHQSGRNGEEDATQSPPVHGQRVLDEDETEVVIRSQWQQHAPAGEQGQGVTQLAAHSIADGKRSSALQGDFCEEGAGAVEQSFLQFWRAGDVGSIRTMAGLPISMTEFDNRRTVTNGAQRGAAVSVHYPSGQGPDNLRYAEAISRYEPGLIFSSQRVNENAVQAGSDSQLGCAAHSSEDYSVESDKTSVEDDDILDGSRQARGGHLRRTMHSQRHRRTSHRRRFDNKGS